MRMASSVGIGHREAVGNLANGVGIRVSLTLAIESKMMVTSVSSITSVSGVTDSSDDSIGMSSGNLTNCVGIRITVSFTLAVEAVMDTSIASIATIVATVTNSSISRHKAMAIVNTSNDTMAITMGHLSYGVRLTVCQGSTCQDNTKEESHHAVFYGDTLTTTGPM